MQKRTQVCSWGQLLESSTYFWIFLANILMYISENGFQLLDMWDICTPKLVNKIQHLDIFLTLTLSFDMPHLPHNFLICHTLHNFLICHTWHTLCYRHSCVLQGSINRNPMLQPLQLLVGPWPDCTYIYTYAKSQPTYKILKHTQNVARITNHWQKTSSWSKRYIR